MPAPSALPPGHNGGNLPCLVADGWDWPSAKQPRACHCTVPGRAGNTGKNLVCKRRKRRRIFVEGGKHRLEILAETKVLFRQRRALSAAEVTLGVCRFAPEDPVKDSAAGQQSLAGD